MGKDRVGSRLHVYDSKGMVVERPSLEWVKATVQVLGGQGR